MDLLNLHGKKKQNKLLVTSTATLHLVYEVLSLIKLISELCSGFSLADPRALDFVLFVFFLLSLLHLYVCSCVCVHSLCFVIFGDKEPACPCFHSPGNITERSSTSFLTLSHQIITYRVEDIDLGASTHIQMPA